MLRANELLRQRIQGEKHKDIDPISVVHYELCAIVQGWVPLQDFMQMDVDHIHTLRKCHKEMNKMIKQKMNTKGMGGRGAR